MKKRHRKKSIYELALEETAKQRKKKASRFVKSKRRRRKKMPDAPLFETLDPKALEEYVKSLEKSGPPSMPPNVFQQGINPMDIVMDGASNYRFRRSGGAGRNIQLD